MSQKFLDLAGLTAYDKMLKEWFKNGVVDITDDAINALFVAPVTGPADNEIWYTSSDGNVVTPTNTDGFGANIVSNTYEDGKGVIKFDSPVTSIGYYAFDFCTDLVSITIPKSVTSIGDGAFVECADLTYITCLATTPPYTGSEPSLIWININNGVLYVPSESIETYKSCKDWRDCTVIQPI